MTTYLGAQRLFKALFGTTFGTNAVDTSDTRSVIDKVMEDYKRVLPKLGAEDRKVFQEHIDDINDLDKAVNTGGSSGGGGGVVTAATCDVSKILAGDVINSDPNVIKDGIQKLWLDHAKVVSRAIKCGLTQLVMINVKSGRSNILVETVDSKGAKVMTADTTFTDTGGDTSIHGASHNAVYASTSAIDSGEVDSENFAYNRLLGAHQWTAEKVFLTMFKELDTKGANGVSFMNNGIVAWTQENSAAHAAGHIPVAVLTRRPDIAGNRVIDFTHWQNSRVKPGGDLYKTINGVKTKTNTGKTIYAGTSYRRFLSEPGR